MVSKQFSSGMPWNQSFLRANANQVPGPAEVILFSAPYWARVYGVFVIPSHTYWCYWLLFNLSKLFFFSYFAVLYLFAKVEMFILGSGMFTFTYEQ